MNPKFVYSALISGLVFGVLDSIWFYLFMKKFAQNSLRTHIEIIDGKWSINLSYAILAYSLMVVSSVMFLQPQINTNTPILKTIILGFIFGVCIFGIFDFTNGALFTNYPFKFMLIDTIWGGFMYLLLALIYRYLV